MNTLRMTSACAAALALLVSSASAAAPANDDRANAATLQSSVTATGTTDEATLEAGEPIPAGWSAPAYQGSVWWNWTPANVGITWHELSTEGSSTDTVLSVWSDQNGAGPLTLIHVNTSRLQFQADSAVTYKIAVASRSATRGSVSLKAFVIPTPFAGLDSANFTPSTVDVSTSAASITAEFVLSCSQEIISGSLGLYDQSNNLVASTAVDATHRTAGTIASGAYGVSISVPQGSPAGTYHWRLGLVAGAYYNASFGWEGLSALPAGVPTSISVQNDPFKAWASAKGLSGADAAPNADPDHDRMPNYMEYACGLDPTKHDRATTVQVSGSSITRNGAPAISMTGTGAQQHLRIVYLRRVGDTGTAPRVQFCDSLSGWTDSTATPVVIASSATHEALMVEDTCCVAEKTTRFARVQY